MSKYYKGEDVIKCVAQYIMTDAKRDNYYVCGDIEAYIEFTEAILADLPTIDIVNCVECVYRGDDWWCYKHEFTPIPIEDFFCKDGERIDNE